MVPFQSHDNNKRSEDDDISIQTLHCLKVVKNSLQFDFSFIFSTGVSCRDLHWNYFQISLYDENLTNTISPSLIIFLELEGLRTERGLGNVLSKESTQMDVVLIGRKIFTSKERVWRFKVLDDSG